MTSFPSSSPDVEVERRVDQVLRAPRAERWTTLINQPMAARTLDGLVDRFARSERALEDSQDAVRIQAEELMRLTKAIEDFCRHFNVVPKWGESWSVAGLQGVKAQYAQLQQDLQEAKKAKESWPDDIKTIESLRKQLATQVEAFANAKESWRSAQANYERSAKERDQLRQELSATQINLHDHAAGIAAVIKQRDEAKAEVKSLKEELDQARVRIRELNLGIARAQDVRQDRQTDAQLFLELVRAGYPAGDARTAVAMANDIRKNGLTPQT